MFIEQSTRDRRATQDIPQHEPHRTPPSRGQVVMGPGFYVWDESPREAREWGLELATAHVISSS